VLPAVVAGQWAKSGNVMARRVPPVKYASADGHEGKASNLCSVNERPAG
jgi:hypothetical protein